MKILFTGGSSFTGLWFLRELTAAGPRGHCSLPKGAPRNILTKFDASVRDLRPRLAGRFMAVHLVMKSSWN